MHLYLFSNQEQLRLLLQSLLLGAGAGLLYDALRALRRQTGCGRAMTAVLDAVFWLVLSAAVFPLRAGFCAGTGAIFRAGRGFLRRGAVFHRAERGGAGRIYRGAVGGRRGRSARRQLPHRGCKTLCTARD